MKYFKRQSGKVKYWYASQTGGLGACLKVVDFGDRHYEVETQAYLAASAELSTEEDFISAYSKALDSFEKFVPKPF